MNFAGTSDRIKNVTEFHSFGLDYYSWNGELQIVNVSST